MVPWQKTRLLSSGPWGPWGRRSQADDRDIWRWNASAISHGMELDQPGGLIWMMHEFATDGTRECCDLELNDPRKSLGLTAGYRSNSSSPLCVCARQAVHLFEAKLALHLALRSFISCPPSFILITIFIAISITFTFTFISLSSSTSCPTSTPAAWFLPPVISHQSPRSVVARFEADSTFDLAWPQIQHQVRLQLRSSPPEERHPSPGQKRGHHSQNTDRPNTPRWPYPVVEFSRKIRSKRRRIPQRIPCHLCSLLPIGPPTSLQRTTASLKPGGYPTAF
jgi:hypothetical protein